MSRTEHSAHGSPHVAWLRPAAAGAASDGANADAPEGSAADARARDPVRLPATGRLTIGRDAACDLCLADPSLSRRHALLVREGATWLVVDEGSSNGTYVNGERIKRQALSGGETLRFGASLSYTLTLERPPRAPRRLPSPAALLCPALVPRDPRVKGKRLLLGRKLTVIGRDATADLVLPHAQISGIHARIERRGSRLVVTDAASMNGTTINGETIREKALRPGDRVSFADLPFDVVLTPVPSIYGALVLIVICLGVVGFLLHPSLQQRGKVQTLWTRADYADQAARSLASALKAYDETPRNETVSRAQFEIAIRSLVAADRLPPDRQTDAELRSALRASAKGARGDNLRGRDPFDLYQDLLNPKPVPPPAPPVVAQVEPAPSPEPTPAESAAPEPAAGSPPASPGSGPGTLDQAAVLDRELAMIFAEFGIDTQEEPLPPTLVATVQRCVDYWTVQRRDVTLRAIRRSAPYLPMIQRKLALAKIPGVFAYLPFVESSFVTGAQSGAGAVGLWQLMAGTARDYGLRVDGQIDQRNDPELATDAACKHLAMLLMRYGTNDCLCAVAAYNKGDNGLLNCLLKSGVDWRSDRKFWDLVSLDSPCLPAETREYVPRFLAAVIVMRRPEQFGLGAY